MSNDVSVIPVTPVAISLSSPLVKMDRVFDYLPGMSTITTIVNLVQKVFLARATTEKINKKYYYRYLADKSTFRCLLLLIPALGNIIILIYDIATRNRETVLLQKIAEGKMSSSHLNAEDAMYALSQKQKNQGSVDFWLAQAVARNSIPAMFKHGKSLFDLNNKKGLEYLLEALKVTASTQHPQLIGAIHYELFDIYSHGKYGCQPSPGLAQQHFSKALDLGNIQALKFSFNKAKTAETDKAPQKGDLHAFDTLVEKAPVNLENLHLKYDLACRFLNGQTYSIEKNKALKLFEEIISFSEKSPEHQADMILRKTWYRYSLCISDLEKRKGIQQGLSKTTFFNGLLEDQTKDAETLYLIGMIYLHGRYLGVSQDVAQGKALLKEAASKSSIDAMYALYQAHKKDAPDEALEWLCTAAKNEHPSAACELAKVNNAKVTKHELILLLKLHADKGFPAANYYLFIVYLSKPNDKPEDEFIAFDFLKIAAAQKFREAIDRLAELIDEHDEADSSKNGKDPFQISQEVRDLLDGAAFLKLYQDYEGTNSIKAFQNLQKAMDKGCAEAYEICLELYEQDSPDKVGEAAYAYYKFLVKSGASAEKQDLMLKKAAKHTHPEAIQKLTQMTTQPNKKN